MPSILRKTLAITLCFCIQSSYAERKVIVKLDKELPDYTIANEYLKNQKRYPFITPIKEKDSSAYISHKNIIYRSLGERKLSLDLFQPTISKKPAPAVILVHGGAWRMGDKSHQVPMAQALAESGYVGVSVEYRLSREALYPAGMLDLQAAIRWLKSHHKQYNVDPTKIAILGASSGAHMATLMGMTGHQAELFAKQTTNSSIDSSVQAIINLDGVVNIISPEARKFEDKPGKTSYFSLWLGGRYHEYPSLWQEASPSSYVDKQTPPTLFINSAHDRFHVGRDEYVSTLNKNNIYHEIHTIPDTPHTFWLFHPWFDSTHKFIINFLERVFNGQAPLAQQEAKPFNEYQLKQLPIAEQKAWENYFHESKNIKRIDTEVLAQELKEAGLNKPLPAPKLSQELKKQLDQEHTQGSTIDPQKVDNILSWQTPSGGWSKNTDVYTQARKPGQNFGVETNYVPTFDNGATFTQIRLLSRAYKNQPREVVAKHLQAAINFLITAQFPIGGGPQTYPLVGNYHDWTTYNDDVISNFIRTYLDINDYPNAYAANEIILGKINTSLRKALDNIIADQIHLTTNTGGWGQQHDPITHSLRPARAFEMSALATTESASLLYQLMRIAKPSDSLKNTIKRGHQWLQETKIEQTRWQRNSQGNSELVHDKNAPYLWPRMIDTNTGKAVFGDRDGSVHNSIEGISLERQNNYGWYQTSPEKILLEFPKWEKRVSPLHETINPNETRSF
jgi:pectinesterase